MNVTGGTANFQSGTGEQTAGYVKVKKGISKNSKAMDYKKLFETEKLEEILSPEDYEKTVELLDKIKQEKPEAYKKILNMVIDLRPYTFSDIEKTVNLNEGFNTFKQTVSKRKPSEQMELAIREIKKKLSEVSKIMEYTSRLKTEIKEGSEDLKLSVKGMRTLEEITGMIKQVYVKSKKLN